MKKYLFALAIAILITKSSFAQFSKTHYIPPLSGSSDDFSKAEQQYMYISTPSTKPVSFTINQLGSTIVSGTVTRDTPYQYYIGNGEQTQLHVDSSLVNQVLTNKGFIVEANDQIYVTVRVRAGQSNQAGELVSKGLAALGTTFRIGSLINTELDNFASNNYTFISVLATENNTTVKFSDIRDGALLINDASSGNTPSDVILNSGESYVLAVTGPTNANRDALIGSLVSSDKPIAVNCGSFTGSNGKTNTDLGFDQIVSAERTGKEYIFIKSTGQDPVERVLLVAHEDNTDIYLNGNTGTPDYTLNHSDYIALDGAQFASNGNMYVRTSKKVFAYQTVGDNARKDYANQELFFVPPLSCETPKSVDNVPLIEKVGTETFKGRATIVTKTGSPLNFIINGINYTYGSLPGNLIKVGPTSVNGNPDYETYTITGLTGNVSVISTTELYLAAYGSSGAATFGGFYSGFTFKPEVTFQTVNVSQSNCIPNVELNVNSLTGFDTFQWYFNDTPIAGATTSSFSPTAPGYYYVSATLTTCNIKLDSDKIPVSSCPENGDNDSANDNIDIDLDKDGITNCVESYGDFLIDNSVQNGTISKIKYSNYYSTSVKTSATATSLPFSGKADGNFVLNVAAGKGNFVTYSLVFSNPISLKLEYLNGSGSTNLMTSNSEFIITTSSNNTLTILNPDNQLLVDTNYDGFYESGVTQFSSFEIRFRLNSGSPLPAGTGTFSIQGHLTDNLSITHKNLVDFSNNSVGLLLSATCLPRDWDNDGIADQLDFDTDNDGISDIVEYHAKDVVLKNTDVNKDGLDDDFLLLDDNFDSDSDNVLDYMDLDSDNDGVFDVVESGSNALDVNNDGMIDGVTFGTNGLADSLESIPDSGKLNYSILDTDGDKIYNYISSDSDSDSCSDVIEAGFLDADQDSYLGGAVTISPFGVVTSAVGYSKPNTNYLTPGIITITTEPKDATICELKTTSFTIETNTVKGYQWEYSADGITWNTITDNATYAGSTTKTLTITGATASMDQYQYRVQLSKDGNTCGKASAIGKLIILPLPTFSASLSLVQCDDDTDGISTFNLKQKESLISKDYKTLNFTYYTSQAGAESKDAVLLIANPTAFTTDNVTIWIRAENDLGCFSIGALQLKVSATQLPPTFHKDFYTCDDFIDATQDNKDGISSFDFSSVTTDILALLPKNAVYTINYFKNKADALAETDSKGVSLAIASISDFRNTSSPKQQDIWVRVDSDVDNACFGLGPYVTLHVESIPEIYTINSTNTIRKCDDDNDGVYAFDTSTIEADSKKNQTDVVVSYFDENGVAMSSPLPNPMAVTGTKTIKIRIQNSTTKASNGPCFDEKNITFIVDKMPTATAIANAGLTSCDNEIDPLLQDGSVGFDTSTFNATITGTQTGIDLKYYLPSGTLIGGSLSNPFETKTQTIKAVVENSNNPSCYASVFIPFVVNPLPKIDTNSDSSESAILCTEKPNAKVTLNSGLTNIPTGTTFNWTHDGIAISTATSKSVVVNEKGIYMVKVTNAQGCSATRTIEVKGSQAATITNILIDDFSDNNSVEVQVTGNGNYAYALQTTNPYAFQNSSTFSNVPMGIYTVLVKDNNGCGIVEQQITVLGAPKFFTPNGDGIHDTWSIIGISNTFNLLTKTQIFDRYGQLMKQLIGLDVWDGTLNGQELPATDYWFTVQLENGKSANGHFALKR